MLLLLVHLLAPAQACGPFLAQALVLTPPEALWSAPVADFATELAPILPPRPFAGGYTDPIDRELTLLKPLGVDTWAYSDWRQGRDRAFTWPAAAPEALRRYATGARLWRQGSRAEALQAWEHLRELPAAERADWTVQVQFMAAMAEPTEAAFLAVAQAIEGGAPDPLGLRAVTLGERARLRLHAGDLHGAIELYAEQAATGSASALLSLDLLSREAIAQDQLTAWAAHPLTAQVLTAWILAHGGPVPNTGEVETTRRWMAALGDRPSPAADRLAWMAYQIGDIPLTEAWLAKAEASPLSHWLRGTLLARSGDLKGAEAALQQAANGFGPDTCWTAGASGGWDAGRPLYPAQAAWGQIGALRLAQDNFPGALVAFGAAGNWVDTAYVAERLLPTAEAEALRIAEAPAPPPRTPAPPADAEWFYAWPAVPLAPGNPTDAALRYLLARKALREGGPLDLPAYPPAVQEAALAYEAARQQLGAALTAEAKAAARWRLARLTRDHGLELLGTELEPDFRVYEGDYKDEPSRADRVAGAAGLPVTPEESARFGQSAPHPDRRWHYRAVAAEEALAAAALLDKDDPRVDTLTCYAMAWLDGVDPERRTAVRRAYVRAHQEWPSGQCDAPTFGDEGPILRRRAGIVGGFAVLIALFAAWWRRRRATPSSSLPA